MDVVAVCEYLGIKKQRVRVESLITKAKKELSDLEVRKSDLIAKESDLAVNINSDSLITARSAKTINELLSSHRPLWYRDIPVSFVQVNFKNGRLLVQMIFSQPVFSGWMTEKPYISYQFCPWSLEVPEPPSKNHIPQYTRTLDGTWDVVCWDEVENGLRLWVDEKRGLLFKWIPDGLSKEY